MSSICRSGEPTKPMWGKTFNRLVEQQLHMEAETQDGLCPGPVESPPNQFIMEVAALCCGISGTGSVPLQRAFR